MKILTLREQLVLLEVKEGDAVAAKDRQWIVKKTKAGNLWLRCINDPRGSAIGVGMMNYVHVPGLEKLK